jgi:hypothetical protein
MTLASWSRGSINTGTGAVIKTSDIGLNSLMLAVCVGALGANLAIADPTTPTTTSLNGVYVEGTSKGPPGLITDPFNVVLGGYIVGTNFKATLNGHSVSTDTPIDFNQTFGTGSDFNRFRLDAVWRITPKHHVRALWFQSDVTRSRNLTKNIEWGDYTFQANANIKATNNLGVYELAYEYAFITRPDFELTGSFGVHLLNMQLKLSGAATLTNPDGTTTSVQSQTKASNLPAPLPVIGVGALWAVVPNVYLNGSAQVFKFSYDGYNGNWSDLRATGTWMFSRHFGAGLGYDWFHVNVDVSSANFNGKVALGYSGLQLFLTGSF